jgi:hypothetical protein
MKALGRIQTALYGAILAASMFTYVTYAAEKTAATPAVQSTAAHTYGWAENFYNDGAAYEHNAQ